MKKNVHVIAHSHWDREWYMPFEYHRARLVRLIDDCMELFETDEDFKSFHLDGHTLLLEDYLEIKPQNRERIKKYVEEGKFAVGPWYVLQDEFLTSEEANVRNLLVGMSLAREFGKPTLLGYFPDSFGNAGQMPQLMKQAGMKAIAFGRGVKPTGMNNSVSEGEGYQSQFSELYWQSPDGSMLPSILFANWYNNGWHMPADGDHAYWDRVLASAEKYASTGELLLLNGCDHQPVQRNLSQALKAAREEYPDYHFIHSDFEQYVNALLPELPDNLTVCRGELIGQDTDGWYNLVNTASSHVDLKIMNKEGENLLTNAAEPLSVIAAQLGKAYPHEMLLYAWKTLMKNHPHDSICGCSCDAVNEEMRTRFQKSRQAAETVVLDALEYLSHHVDCAGLEDASAVFAVVNPFAGERGGLVTVDVDIKRSYMGDNLHRLYCQMEAELGRESLELVDGDGNVIPCMVTDERARFGYELPDDCFRKPYVARAVTVRFEAEAVPAMGYKVYGLRAAGKKEKVANAAASASGEKSEAANAAAPASGEIGEAATLVTGENVMENPYLKVSVMADGTINVLDKENQREFAGLLRLEDAADLGSEYTFVPSPGDVPILSGSTPARIELVCDEPFLAEYKITTELLLPKEMDEEAQRERNTNVDWKERKGGRSRECVVVPVTSYVSLTAHGRSVKVKTELTNTARDHRLRVLFPTGLACSQHKAESVFEAVTRDNQHKPTWTYPSGCEHQQGFVMLKDERSGFAIANIGLYEYEILKDNTIAVTLVRAVGELGDWGIFPTELSQMQKPLSFDYEITPFGQERDVWMELAAFQYALYPVQVMGPVDGAYKNHALVWSGDNLKPCAFKPAQDSNDIIMRWTNYSDCGQTLTIRKTDWIDNLYRSNVLEERQEVLPDKNGVWEIAVKPYEIVTLGCRKQ